MTKFAQEVGPESLRDFRHSLPMELLRAREAAMARFRPVLREHGLTEAPTGDRHFEQAGFRALLA